MIILALDPGIQTGYAIIGYDGELSAVVSRAGAIETGKENRELDIYNALANLVYGVDAVAMEQLLAFHGRMSGDRYMIEGVIMLFMQQHKISLEAMHPSTVKAFITGKGNAKKADMRAVLKELIEMPAKSNVHAVDAVAVGLTWLHKNKGFTF